MENYENEFNELKEVIDRMIADTLAIYKYLKNRCLAGKYISELHKYKLTILYEYTGDFLDEEICRDINNILYSDLNKTKEFFDRNW